MAKGMIELSSRNQYRDLLFVMRDALLAFVAISGYLYYCYKFGSPDLGANDFYHYREMVERPLDLEATSAPFVLRQIPTFIAYLFYKYGIFYQTETNLDLILPGAIETKKIFFALILSNALATAASLTVALQYIRHKTRNNDILVCFSYLGIMLSYFLFPFSFIAPLSYGWGWLASAALAVALLEKRLSLILLGCIMALFTRETVLIFVLALSIFAWASFGRMDRFYLRTAGIVAATSVVLVFVRSHFVHGYEDQMDLRSLVTNITSFWPSRQFVFQSIIPQVLIVVLILSLSRTHGLYAIALFLSMITVMIVAIGTGTAPFGRIIGETLPFYGIVLLLSKFGVLMPSRLEQPRQLNAPRFPQTGTQQESRPGYTR